MESGHVRGILKRLHAPSPPPYGSSGEFSENAPRLRLLRMVATRDHTFGLPTPPTADRTIEVKDPKIDNTLDFASLMSDILIHRPHLVIEIVAPWKFPSGRDVYDVYSSVARHFPGRLLLQDVEDFSTAVDAPEYLIHRSESWRET